MAISMSGATVETGQRDSLLGSTVDTSVTSGGATANTQGKGLFGLFGSEATGAALAGVTAEFATKVSGVIDNYCTEVRTKLNQLESVESNSAFQGSGVSGALTKFINSVKDVANSYLDKLKAAEVEITASVAAAYATQDTDLSGNMSSDASALESNSIS